MASAPTNAVGTGNISGVDKPFVKPKTFAGMPVFSVDDDTFTKCRFCKIPHDKWFKYVPNNKIGKSIHNYAMKNPGKDILIQNKNGMMTKIKQSKKSTIKGV